MRRVGFDEIRGHWIRAKLCGSFLAVCVALIVGAAPPALAQGNVSVAADTPGAAGSNIPPSGELSPTGEYKEGLAVGPWMYYPSIFVGGAYNSNSNQAPSGQAVKAPTRIPVGARAWLRA